MASTSEGIGTVERKSLIEQFCSVTGANFEKAQKMLEVCNWNLEMSINMHVDTECLENLNTESSVNGVEEIENIRAPIPQSRGILLEEEIPFHYGLRGRKRRSHTVFDGFRDFQAEAELHGQSASLENSEHLKKRRTLEDLFRPPLDLMYRGNFNSAKDYGQAINRWLMVNLQNSQEFACQVLNRDVWSNPQVKRLISQNFVFWQVYNDSSDGEKYMQFYQPESFPYIAIIDPLTGEKKVVWHSVDAPTICELINAFLKEEKLPDGSSSSLSTASGAKYSLLDKSEEEQLRAALEASIQDSIPINVEDNDSDLETFDSDSESASGKISAVGNVSLHSDYSNDTIDVVGNSESNESNKNSSTDKTWKDYLGNEDDLKSDLVLRLPDGKREQISWPCTTKLKSLLLYIGSIGYNPEKYELVTNYPRRNLCQLDLFKSLKEVNLFPREMIIVQLKM